MQLNKYLTILFFLLFTAVQGQKVHRCSLCGMDINQPEFKALVEKENGKFEHFDSVECLVNYVKTKDENEFEQLLVTDFNSEQEIDAEKAFYLKSKNVPSPMGAYLSAYKSKKDVQLAQEKNGGEILDWNTLNERFTSSSFGKTEHLHHHHGPNSYAPSGIMGDHLHPKGGVMVSFRSMFMSMAGNRMGSSKIEDADIFQNYMVAPQNMTMEMFMLGLMYAPSDKVTLMLMQNLVTKDMDLTSQMTMPNGMVMNNDFSTSSSGLGDLKLGALYGIVANGKHALHLNAKVNIPIGEIENRATTPMMENAKLPYAMQLGTGTFDWTLGATYKYNFSNILVGIQQLNTLSTGRNSQGYRFGNIHELNIWAGYNITNKIGINTRISASTQSAISGNDEDLNPMMVPTARASNYGGELVNAGLGTNILLAKGKLILGLDFNAPIYQKFNGLFMSSDYTINAGIRYNVL
ncbi:nitrous oxide reductase accessory protein NosL [Muricauda sp. 2012CJ35-5]|uniref:Nitrous oxide reductase accessory protein NosL n=1 Tax=Flagellimonas spongiicola TaxID=2942208 RepID=A0ABT0PWR5_9FLAO|nr:nitrous oxide reductase accessory protein NosL [Allomuricauda spongiicola]MCL6275601.1 nitrous oxide reductase accessory protein NosL [Allomuricauda spongiicola]